MARAIGDDVFEERRPSMSESFRPSYSDASIAVAPMVA
jgi:hypothetical protein